MFLHTCLSAGRPWAVASAVFLTIPFKHMKGDFQKCHFFGLESGRNVGISVCRAKGGFGGVLMALHVHLIMRSPMCYLGWTGGMCWSAVGTSCVTSEPKNEHNEN